MGVDYSAKLVYGFAIPGNLLFYEFNKTFSDACIDELFDKDNVVVYGDNEYADPSDMTYYIGVDMEPGADCRVDFDKLNSQNTLDAIEFVREQFGKLNFMNLGEPHLYLFTRVH